MWSISVVVTNILVMYIMDDMLKLEKSEVKALNIFKSDMTSNTSIMETEEQTLNMTKKLKARHGAARFFKKTTKRETKCKYYHK